MSEMHCPSCRRPTRPRHRGRYKDAEGDYPPGTLLAATFEGFCYACYAPTVGPPRDGVRQRIRIAHMKASELDLECAARSIGRYMLRRRARGVPEEGAGTDTLVRPGLFLREVP